MGPGLTRKRRFVSFELQTMYGKGRRKASNRKFVRRPVQAWGWGRKSFFPELVIVQRKSMYFRGVRFGRKGF